MIHDYNNQWALNCKSKFVLLAVAGVPADWQKELNKPETIKKMEIIEILNKEAEELGLSFAETIQVAFKNRKIETYSIL